MNYEETLSTLKAIQASYAPVPFLANSETEPRFVIDSDTREIIIPEEFKFLAVKMDHMSEKIYFEIPRYFDDEDLTTKICVVQYINTNGDAPIEAIVAAIDVDTESEDGKIIFRWDVDNYLTRYAGMVSFAVRFYTISDDNRFTYSWNTLPATLPVLDTLDNTNDTVSQNYPTELVQWQFRMSELDRTISGKIAEATVTIDADVKAAQTARKGAEDAEARVNAIVAGNEAYTKQQSHDLFALALRGSAEAAKSITIYPDKGSNVVATIKGFTKQEGSGDASPANVRPIINGGKKLVELVLTGSESARLYSGLFYLDGFPGIKAKSEYNGYCNSFAYGTYLSGKIGVNLVGNSVIYAPNNDYSADNNGLNAFKSMLAFRYAAGNPVKIWYAPSDESQATGLYAPLTGTGDGHTGACGKLTAKLCQGDTLITKVKSGCDMQITLDGGTSDGFVYADEGASGNMRRMRITIPGVLDYNSGGFGFSDRVKYQANYGSTEESFYCTVDGVFIFLAAESLAAAKQILSQKPLTMWLRSTSYTEKNDKPVSLETHAKHQLTVTSKLVSSVDSQKVAYINLILKGKGTTYPICSHMKQASPYSNPNGIYVNANESTIAFKLSEEFNTKELVSEYVDSQLSTGTPVTIVYELLSPVVYAHDPVDFIASPDDEGAWVITGEADGTVSAEYNKNITKALEDILTRVSALELHALGG